MRWAAAPTQRWRAGWRRVAPDWSALPAVSARRPIAARIARSGERVAELHGARGSACWRGSPRHRRHLDGCAKLLASLSYQGVLQRGYALVRDSEGRTLRSAAQIAAGQRLDIELADGHVDAQALGSRARAVQRPHHPAPRRAASAAQANGGDGGGNRARCFSGVGPQGGDTDTGAARR